MNRRVLPLIIGSLLLPLGGLGTTYFTTCSAIIRRVRSGPLVQRATASTCAYRPVLGC